MNTQGSINETREYTYSDFYDRLVQTAVTKGGTTKTTSYSYDPAGNRISMTENGSTTTYEYNGLNQLKKKTDTTGTTFYTYDSRGNHISESSSSGKMEFEYFITGELKKVKQSGITIQENKYDHEGIRVSREENNTVRDYYYVNGRPVYTTDNEEKSSANLVNPYGSILSTYRGTSGQNAYTYLTDIQGSTGSLMDESGTAEAVYSYSDFGEVTENITSDIDNEICYTGAVYDDTTGLHYMNARYYDPENGRFISQDSYRGELNDAGQWHLYVYCANNPINYVDPSGHARKRVVDIYVSKAWFSTFMTGGAAWSLSGIATCILSAVGITVSTAGSFVLALITSALAYVIIGKRIKGALSIYKKSKWIPFNIYIYIYVRIFSKRVVGIY